MKYILNGRTFEKILNEPNLYRYMGIKYCLDLHVQDLIALGAVEEDTCGKCGEREETELCPKCGAESYGNCPCKPKEEKIKEPNYPIGYIGGESKNLITTADFKRWVSQVTNKLNKVSE